MSKTLAELIPSRRSWNFTDKITPNRAHFARAKRAVPTSSDLGPSGDEARSRRQETVAPVG